MFVPLKYSFLRFCDIITFICWERVEIDEHFVLGDNKRHRDDLIKKPWKNVFSELVCVFPTLSWAFFPFPRRVGKKPIWLLHFILHTRDDGSQQQHARNFFDASAEQSCHATLKRAENLCSVSSDIERMEQCWRWKMNFPLVQQQCDDERWLYIIYVPDAFFFILSRGITQPPPAASFVTMKETLSTTLIKPELVE